MSKSRYTQYNLLLDPGDAREQKMIEYLKSKKGNKINNSYSAILKRALDLLMKQDEVGLEALGTEHKSKSTANRNASE